MERGKIYNKRDYYIHNSGNTFNMLFNMYEWYINPYLNIIESFLTSSEYSELLSKNKNTIIVDNYYETYMELEDILNQLEEHIKQNIIKVIIIILYFY